MSSKVLTNLETLRSYILMNLSPPAKANRFASVGQTSIQNIPSIERCLIKYHNKQIIINQWTSDSLSNNILIDKIDQNTRKAAKFHIFPNIHLLGCFEFFKIIISFSVSMMLNLVFPYLTYSIGSPESVLHLQRQ